MRLTDSTEIRPIAGGAFLAVTSGPRAIATLVRRDAARPCNWLVQGGYTEDGDRPVYECGASAIIFDNGFACTAGHEHRTDAEYFDADEIEGARIAGRTLPTNARSIEGGWSNIMEMSLSRFD